MKSIIKAINIFTFRIDFNYKNQKVFHSTFGFILSFLLYSAMIFFFYYFSKDFFQKTNPMLFYQETEFTDKYTFKFKDVFKSLKFSYFSKNISKNKSDSVYPNLMRNIQFWVLNGSDSNFCESFILKFKNSSNNNQTFGNIIEKTVLLNQNILYFKNSINNTCPFYDSKFNFVSYTEKNINNLNITIDNNSVIKLTLDSNYIFEMNSKNFEISNLYFDYYISDIAMNAEKSDFFSPFDIADSIFIKNFSKNKLMNAFYVYNYGIVKSIDDNGFILSEKKYHQKIKKFYQSHSQDFGDSDLITLLEMKFDKIMKIYERKYKKFQNVLADLGGVINSLIMIGNFIIYEFNKNIFFYSMINQMFVGETIQENSHDKVFRNKNNNLDNTIDYEIKRQNNNSSITENNQDSSRSINGLNRSKIILNSENNIYSRKFEDRKINNPFIDKLRDRNATNKIYPDMFNFSKISKNNTMISMQDNTEIINKSINNNKSLNKFGKNLSKIDDNLMKLKIKQFIKFTKQKTSIINFHSFDFLKIILCNKIFKNKEFISKENIFNEFTKKISDYLNVINYCSLFQNFEKLKMILLNENQNFIFNHLKTIKIKKSLNDDNQMQLEQVYKYFKSNSNILNDVDNRILNNLCSTFSCFLLEK